jgi:pantetheine-phosphate adenylyltransferase
MDFEYEFQINALNRHLAPDVETVYFMASPEHSFLSSSVIREIGSMGGNIRGLVPDSIQKIIAERLKRP